MALADRSRDTHNESSSVSWVISLTTDSNTSIQRRRLLLRRSRLPGRASTERLVLHRVIDWHGMALMDMSLTDKTPHSRGLSLDFPSNLSKLWSKNRRPADTNSPAAAGSPDEGSDSESLDRERSVVSSPSPQRAPALTSKRAETSIARGLARSTTSQETET
ncbi:hypothetical protein Q9189_003928 [Teloschistes chrysophthalmus]